MEILSCKFVNEMAAFMLGCDPNFVCELDIHNTDEHPGDGLNIKMPSHQYRDPHVKDKTV